MFREEHLNPMQVYNQSTNENNNYPNKNIHEIKPSLTFIPSITVINVW